MNKVKGYLQATCKAIESLSLHPINGYLCYEDVVLRNGREFTWAPRPQEVARGRIKACFRNSTEVATENPSRYFYCEGYAYSLVVPVHHAWVCDSDGRAIECTWPEENEPPVYYGIAFRLDYLLRVIRREWRYGALTRSIYTDPPEQWMQQL